MLEGINNIFNRINEIQNVGKNLTENFKPEKVKEFENLYNEAISKTSGENDSKQINEVHPYLQKQENNVLSNIDSNEKKILISDAVKNASKKYMISEDLINAVIKNESAYNPLSVSRTGAMGLMQLMPQTALEMGVEEPFSIDDNIDGGTKYLRLMLDKYNGNLDKALAAYNAGPQRVDDANGIPNIPETINYVKQVKKTLFK
jgi:soluble lytic murein transglycosylase-like protein